MTGLELKKRKSSVKHKNQPAASQYLPGGLIKQYQTTYLRVESNLAKVCIAVWSPIVAANGFVRS